MGIWILNLIDNRDEDRNTPEKFRQCKARGILAIGWAKEDPLTYYHGDDLKAYKKAINGLSRMEDGDLVWVRDTVNKEYYICRVYGALEKAPPHLWDKDIGQYRKARWYGPVSRNALPAPITARRLVSRSAVRPVHKPDVIQATHDFFESMLVHKEIPLGGTE